MVKPGPQRIEPGNFGFVGVLVARQGDREGCTSVTRVCWSPGGGHGGAGARVAGGRAARAAVRPHAARRAARRRSLCGRRARHAAH